ncbi:hypothetical protein ACFXGT_20630 [Streptomyces sp. NPDC059352]|uniref:hypothetical protein n=1 Tax=Streptomyces sp. NPDC059352 TaxID=3346810 RepID=UPI003688C323
MTTLVINRSRPFPSETLGRFLCVSVVLAAQLMQLAQLGSDAAIRDDIFYGGALIFDATLPEHHPGRNSATVMATPAMTVTSARSQHDRAYFRRSGTGRRRWRRW